MYLGISLLVGKLLNQSLKKHLKRSENTMKELMNLNKDIKK